MIKDNPLDMLLARTALARKAQPSPLDTALLAFPYHQPAGGHQLRQWRGRSLQVWPRAQRTPMQPMQRASGIPTPASYRTPLPVAC